MFDDLGPSIPVRSTAEHTRTVGEMFTLRVARSRTNPALFHKVDGRWQKITWADFFEEAARVAAALGAAGLERGDRVAILGPTQPAWAFYDLGAQLAGMVSFGIYPKQAPEQVRYLLEHSEAKVIFVDGDEELETVLEAAEGLDSLKQIVPWTDALFQKGQGRDDRLTHPSTYADAEPLSEAAVQAIQDEVDPEDTAIFIYTSGTTGPPKGAMISHQNILSLLSASRSATEFLQSDISLNFLPMAHAAERVLGFYSRVAGGVPGAYAESVGTVLKDLGEVNPTIFGSVPRIFEKAYARIFAELEKKPPAVQRIFAWAEGVAREATPYLLKGRPMPPSLRLRWKLADRLVFRTIRGAFGGKCRLMITGAAPIAHEILSFFWGVGLPVYEAYGMTEATVVTHINREGAVKLGTVGRVIPGAECRVAEDGEILIRAPWVFKGYYKNPEATAKTVIDDWLHTGDVGLIDDEGYLRITDRKKHLIITAGGKNLAPANIENAIKKEDPLISQVHAHGDRRPYVSALVAPSAIETLEMGVDKGLITKQELEERTAELMANPSGRSEALNAAMAKVVVLPEFEARIQKAVARGNAELARVEKVRRFVILERDFSQEHGELTPTMKLKRKAVEAKFSELFDRIYEDKEYALEPTA